MSISTYSELQTAGLNWLDRVGDADCVARLPEFIALAEAKLRRRLNGKLGEIRSQNVSVSAEYTALPGDLIALHRATLLTSPRAELILIPDDGMSLMFDGSGGTPTHIAQVASSMRLAPSPSATFTVEIVYAALPALTAGAPSNWLLTAYPDAYLKATLVEAGNYYGDGRTSSWEQEAYGTVDPVSGKRIGGAVGEINKTHSSGSIGKRLSPTITGNVV